MTPGNSTLLIQQVGQTAGITRNRIALNVPQQTSRVTRVDARPRNIFRNYGSGPDNYTIADRNRQHSCVRPYANLVADRRRPPEIRSALSRASDRKQIVDEHGAVRDKAILPNRDKLTNESVRLDAASLPDNDSTLDLDKWSNKTTLADNTTI
jgi:hypothetical protein